MSATNRGAERAARDYYPTPAWCVHRLLDRIGHRLPYLNATWFEPCVGSAAIVDAVESWYGYAIAWTLVDLEPQTTRPATRANYFDCSFDERFDVAITNPPYSDAYAFVEFMRSDARIAIALLRLNVLEGEERAHLWRHAPADVFVLPNRPSYTDDGGTDATAYAWFVWGLTEGGHLEVLDTTPVRVRRPR